MSMLSQRSWVNWLFTLALLFLIVTGIFTYRQLQQSFVSTNWVIHTYKVLEEAKQIQTAFISMRAETREYLLTENTAIIKDLNQLQNDAIQHTKNIKLLTQDNPDQQLRIEHLRSLTNQRFHLIQKLPHTHAMPTKPQTVQLSFNRQLQALHDKMMQIIDSMTQEEIVLLTLRTNLYHYNIEKSNLMLIVIGGFCALLLLLSFIILNIDLSQRIRKSIQLEQESRLKSEFLANMSHELRTPLNAIIGFSELMFNSKVGSVSKDQKEYLGDILTSARHLLQLINDVLDLAKVESGKMEFHPEPINLKTTVDEVGEILRTLIASKRIHFSIDIDPSLTEIVIDPAKLKQVLYNLTSNALKFTPENGQVEIRLYPENEDFFRLEVKDSGIGIRKGDLNKIFGKFQQLDASITKKYAGTGLGLSLTKRIIEAQGGKIGFTSKLGKGSIFYAILPKIALQDSRSLMKPRKDILPLSHYAPTILVIEDNLKDQELIVNTLTKAGYRVETAESGSEAIRLSRERKFDAITLDLLLPDMSGWEILKSLRTDSLNTEVPAIIVTVVTEKLASFGFLINDFLTKPLQSEELLAALKRIHVKPHTTKLVMIIDDNLPDLHLAKTVLNNLGYNTIGESNAEHALSTAEKIPPDALILDLLMPGMNGFEFLKQFYETERGRKTPILIWTAKEVSDEERMRLRKYAQSIVIKGDRAITGLVTELQYYFTHTDFIPKEK